MGQEAERGCGFRRVGGMYLTGMGLSVPCDRLPLNIESCPTCGAGLKVTRVPMRVDYKTMYGNHIKTTPTKGYPSTKTYIENGKVHEAPLVDLLTCDEFLVCPICNPDLMKGAVYLLGVGREYTPQSFVAEALKLGVSKRIWAIPRDFKVGESWVLLTHRDAGTKEFPEHEWNEKNVCNFCQSPHLQQGNDPTIATTLVQENKCRRNVPAIFYAYRPEKIEFLVWKSEATPEKIEELEKRGLSVVLIKDGDLDHAQGKARLPKKPEPEQVTLTEAAQ